MGRTQKLLLQSGRPPTTSCIEGQQGGFGKSELIEAARDIIRLPASHRRGRRAFPCLVVRRGKGPCGTRGQCAYGPPQRRADCRQSCGISLEADQHAQRHWSHDPDAEGVGATHGEPGHALTGTTPLHQREDQAELPAMVYVSEVSHLDRDRRLCVRGRFLPALTCEGCALSERFSWDDGSPGPCPCGKRCPSTSITTGRLNRGSPDRSRGHGGFRLSHPDLCDAKSGRAGGGNPERAAVAEGRLRQLGKTAAVRGEKDMANGERSS